jgi:hypothetical protein
MARTAPGQAPDVDHSSHMELVHWLGVILALPASAAVLTASWRSMRAQRRTTRPTDGDLA